MIAAAKRFLFSVAGRTAYDAVATKTRRRAPAQTIKHEDRVLRQADRRKLSATAADAQRNFAIAAWAIRKHLDYVSSFSFQSKTGTDFDDELERFIRIWSRKEFCDVRGRHPLRRLVRLAEGRAVVDGDFFFLKLSGATARGQMQGIESDRIQDPEDKRDSEDWFNGAQVDASGRVRNWAIHHRNNQGGQYVLDRIVPNRSVFVHGYYDRIDQVRGISPLSSALNSYADLYEGFDYALAKIKVAQLFGLAIYREAAEGFQETLPTTDNDQDGTNDSGYEIDFGQGPVLLDLDPGDRAEFLEAQTPATQTVEFLKFITQVVLKSLDIPYSFFDESFTNFYGSRGGLMQYLKSCKAKVESLGELLDDITRWRVGMAIADGDLKLPRGMEFDDLTWEWVPDGVPWWDPAKEVRGNLMAIAAGLDNPQRVCRETGTDAYDNIDRIAELQAYAKEKGVELHYAGVQGVAFGDVQEQPEMEAVTSEA